MCWPRHLCLSHNQIHGLHDLRTYGLNPNLKSITIDGNPLCEKEPSYFALASAMLPQVSEHPVGDIDMMINRSRLILRYDDHISWPLPM